MEHYCLRTLLQDQESMLTLKEVVKQQESNNSTRDDGVKVIASWINH